MNLAVLLGGSATNDARVIRTVRTLGRRSAVNLFCLSGDLGDTGDDEIEVLNVEQDPPRGLGKWLRPDIWFDDLAKAALGTGIRYDIVWANDFPTLPAAARVAEVTGARLVYDSHELYLETANQFPPTDASGVKALAYRALVAAYRSRGRRHERELLDRVDLFVTTNPSYADWFRAAYPGADPRVVMNCPPVAAPHSPGRLRQELGLGEQERVVLYQGVMNRGRGLASLVDCADRLPPDIRLVLLGTGPLESELRSRSERAIFPGVVPLAELPEWTAGADLGVLVLEPTNRSKELSSANKIFEYMAAAIPILATDLPENRRILTECESGYLCDRSDPDGLVERISGILADPDEMRRRGENGRRAHEDRYNWETEERKLLGYVEELLS